MPGKSTRGAAVASRARQSVTPRDEKRRTEKQAIKPPRRGTPKTAPRPRSSGRVHKPLPADAVAKLMNGVAHPDRVRLARAIRLGSATHAQLSQETHLKPGPLYHHLRELERAGIVSHGQRRFELTTVGEGLMGLIDRQLIQGRRPPTRS